MGFPPLAVGDCLPGLAPSVEHSGYVSADFNPHPASAVVVDTIHPPMRVLNREGVADHGMPILREVTRGLAAVPEPDQNWPYRPTGVWIRRIRSRHHHRDLIKMTDNHFVSQDLAVKQPQREILWKKFGKTDGVGNTERRPQKLARRIVVTAIRLFCLIDFVLGDRCTDVRDLQFLNDAQSHRKHSLVLANA